MKMKKFLTLGLAAIMAVSMVGCVNQHPEEANGTAASSDDVRIVATSPATADICDRLELDLVGVCSSTLSTIPERYKSKPCSPRCHTNWYSYVSRFGNIEIVKA